MNGEAVAELRTALRRVLDDRFGREDTAPELSADLLRMLAKQLGELGYLDAGDNLSDGGLGLTGGCAVLAEVASRWGALAVALLPRLLAGHALGRDAVSGTAPLDWGIGLSSGLPTTSPAAGMVAVLNGASARNVLLADALWRVEGAAVAETGALRFDGFREVTVSRLPGTDARADSHWPVGDVGTIRRILLAAVAIGLARGALVSAVRYASQRTQFHRPIAMFGEIRAILTDAAIKLSVAESAVSAVSTRSDMTPPNVAEAAKTLAWTSETASAIADRCQHVHGGYGHMAEFSIARVARDARTLSAWSDPVPVLEDLLADDLGLPRVE